MLGFDHSLAFGVLNVAQFASGHTFFTQRLFEFQEVKPYVVHTTFQVGKGGDECYIRSLLKAL